MSTPDPFVESQPLPEQATTPPDFFSIAKDIAAGLVDGKTGDYLAGAISDGLRKALVYIIGFLITEITRIIGYFVETFLQGAQAGDTEIAKLAAVVVGALLDTDVPAATFQGTTGKDQRAQLAGKLGKLIIDGLFGGNLGDTPQAIAPGAANAEHFVGVSLHLAVEGWLEGLLAELLSLGQIEQVGQLKDTVINVMGIGRLMRRVLAPPTTILIEDPFTWKLNSAFRPKLLGEGLAVKQHIRGRWDLARLDTELGRQGYGSEQIEALINDSRKFLDASELSLLIRYGSWSEDEAVQHLCDQGYERPIATAKLDLEAKKREQELLLFLVTGLEDSALRGFLTNEELRTTLSKFPIPEKEIDLRARMVAARAELPRKELTVAEIAKAFSLGVFDLVEARQKLLDLGFRQGDETTLELIYLSELKSKEDAAAAKKQAAQDKAKAAQQKATQKAADKVTAAAARQTAATEKATAKAAQKAADQVAKQTKQDQVAATRQATKTANESKKAELAAARQADQAAKKQAAAAAKTAAAAKAASDRTAAELTRQADLAAKKADAAKRLADAKAAAEGKKAGEKLADEERKTAAKVAAAAQQAAAKAALEAQKEAARLALEQAKLAAAATRAAKPPAPKKPPKSPKG